MILINGPVSQFFKPVGWIKQRYPLSPYLFVLVAEDLSKYIMEARRLRIVQGVKVGKRESLSHLLFIDDVLLLCFGSDKEGDSLHEILKLYGKDAGMKVNDTKSTLYTSKYGWGIISNIRKIFSISVFGSDGWC